MTLASPPPISPMPVRHHRFTAEQYHCMVKTGVLTQDDRVELINGEIVDMSPIGKEHNGMVNQLLAGFRNLGKDEVVISVQGPVLMDDQSEPEPDLTLLRFRPDFYRKDLPGPRDVLLLIEVADSSIETDRRIKVPLYARAGVSEVWLVDLNAKCIEVYREPAEGRYVRTQRMEGAAMIAPAAFPTHFVKLSELFAD